MKAVIVFKFEDGDVPSPRDIDESFNLVFEFATRLREPESQTYKAFHRVVDNREFNRADLALLANYASTVAQAAEEKYRLPDWMSAPWRDAIMQNAARLRGVAEGLKNLVERSLAKHEAETGA